MSLAYVASPVYVIFGFIIYPRTALGNEQFGGSVHIHLCGGQKRTARLCGFLPGISSAAPPERMGGFAASGRAAVTRFHTSSNPSRLFIISLLFMCITHPDLLYAAARRKLLPQPRMAGIMLHDT